MTALSNIPAWVYKVAIVFATMMWGLAFVVMKDVVDVLSPNWLLGIRFLSAGAILAAVLHRRLKRAMLGTSGKVVAMGAALALFDYLAFLTQTVGLQHTTPGINAFLTAAYCVIVPFVWWLVGGIRPTRFNIGAALLAVCGIWFVSVSASDGAFTMGFGEGMTLACALFFAVHIVFVSRFARSADVIALTVVQFLFEGVYALAAGLLFEPMPALATFTPEVVGQMAFLVLGATIVAFGIQNVSLAYVPPAQASLLLSLESVFGVLFSILIYGEVLTGRLVLGFVLIFVAVIVSETFPLKRRHKGAPADEAAKVPMAAETGEEPGGD